uniref:Uncharacterized protein n=1 Tax=Dunaliella tertiolecta TaxID=3047 RepID=A0A7S3QV17_DUNTE|mmetsp:Transcript_10242/g.27872  ORF Transcript_10242/g.27872 Transcript_10242/m.27872 type:complete len:1317 (+) Transcript_10242:86-4036(+)
MDVKRKSRRCTYYQHVLDAYAGMLPQWCMGAGLFHALTAVTGVFTSMLFSTGHLTIVSACLLTVIGVYFASKWRSTRMARFCFLVYGFLHMVCYLNYVRGKDTVDGVHLYLDVGTHLYAEVPELVFGLTGTPWAAYGMFIGCHITVSTCFYVHCALMSWPWAFVRAVVVHALVLIATRAVHKRTSASYKHLKERAKKVGSQLDAAPWGPRPHKPEAASASSTYTSQATAPSQQPGTTQIAEGGYTSCSPPARDCAAAGYAACGMEGGEESARGGAANMRQCPAMAVKALLGEGFGVDVPSHVPQCTHKGPKKYPPAGQVYQAHMKIHAKLSPAMFPPNALKLLASLLRVKDPSLLVRRSAMREGCILVTLDVMQMAGILSVMQQETHLQECRLGKGMHTSVKEEASCAGAPNDECFRRLQEHVAAAGQQWLRTVGLESVLEDGTMMSVQVLDCVHRFTWDADSASWDPCGSELLPFGCQHSITAPSLVMLLPSTKSMELPPPLPHEQQHRTQASQLSHSKAAPASVELELEVCTSPGQVVVGWEGEKQEQQVNAQSGASVVQLLARMEGCHVPVAVMECKPATVEACNPGSEFMKQKQMLRVRMECKDQPCLVEFELWQQHAILAPACGVLLLPGSMSGVAEELNAWVQPLWDFKEHGTEKVDWDCAVAAAEVAVSASHVSLEASKCSGADWGFATFVADLGLWLEARNNVDGALTPAYGPTDPGSQVPVNPLGLSGSSFNDSALLWKPDASRRPSQHMLAPNQLMECTHAAQQQDENHALLLSTGRRLLYQAIQWSMCNVAELLLQGMLQEPSSLSFAELANGASPSAYPDSAEGNIVRGFDEVSSPRCSNKDELDNCPESLLTLALFSRSPAMLGRVLEWGHKYGNPGFKWDWLFKDANDITPLQRMQVLSSTHQEMLEMALADLHAGPGLLDAWLKERPHACPQQQGSSGELPPLHSATSPPAATTAPVVASCSSPACRSAPNHAHTPASNHTSVTEVPAASHPRSFFSVLKDGTAPALRESNVQQHDLPFCVWLLRSVVWGFQGGDMQAARFGPQAASTFFGHQGKAQPQGSVQQQQQQIIKEKDLLSSSSTKGVSTTSTTVASGSQSALSEAHYRAWALHRAAPLLQKLSVVSAVLPALLLASPLMSANSFRSIEWHFQWPAVPFCCGLSLLSLTTLVLTSRLNTTVAPRALEAWLSVAAVLRAMNYVLLGSGVLPGLPSHPDCSFMWYILLVWEAGASVVEQVPFLLGVVVRALLLAIHATVCLKSAAPDLTAPVGLLHSVCAAMWLAHSLKQRNTFVSIFASPKADKAQ